MRMRVLLYCRGEKKMSDLNFSGLVGRVTQDAVLKQSEKGTPILSFNIAVNRARKVGENWEEKPHFFWLNLFGKRAENMSPYLLKGQTVSIEGHLEQDRWESNGVQHSKMSLMIDNIRLIGSLKKTSNTAGNEDIGDVDSENELDISDENTDSDFNMNINEFSSDE
jgi:single-strand DNA-binding protein